MQAGLSQMALSSTWGALKAWWNRFFTGNLLYLERPKEKKGINIQVWVQFDGLWSVIIGHCLADIDLQSADQLSPIAYQW